jgi:hypothetical protein
MMENIVDVAHFPVTHHFEVPESRNESLTIDGPFLTHRATHGVRVLPSRMLEMLGLRHLEAVLEASLHGLGYLVARTFITNDRIKLRSTTLQLATPIDENETMIHQLTSVNRLFRFGPLDSLLLRFARATAKTAIMADIPIWENKIYRTTPMLAQGDGPIIKFRKWAGQFYEETSRLAMEA